MKRVLFLSLFLMSIVSAEIIWEDYDSGVIQARSEKFPMLIMFSSPDCKVCKYMKSKVYTQEAIQEYIDENFVAIEIDSGDNPDSGKFELLGTPNYFFLDADGGFIMPRMLGGAKAEDFLETLKKVIKQAELPKKGAL